MTNKEITQKFEEMIKNDINFILNVKPITQQNLVSTFCLAWKYLNKDNNFFEINRFNYYVDKEIKSLEEISTEIKQKFLTFIPLKFDGRRREHIKDGYFVRRTGKKNKSIKIWEEVKYNTKKGFTKTENKRDYIYSQYIYDISPIKIDGYQQLK